YGPLFGTAILIGIAETIASLHEIGLMLYGAILLAVLLVFPEGATGLVGRVFGRLQRNTGVEPAKQSGTLQEALPVPSIKGGRLEIEKLTKSYAGVTALRDVSLTVEPGTVHALI